MIDAVPWWRRYELSALLVFAGIAGALWLGQCWCAFPGHLFNEVRLQPSFLLEQGLNIFPKPGSGPVTTWIYGPIAPVLFMPATLATGAAGALLIGATINLILIVGSVCVTCVFWPVPRKGSTDLAIRTAAAILCIALWPESALQHLQPDSVAVAAGLLANLFLVRSRSEASLLRWAAAAAGVVAIGSKQTALGVVLAQVIWLGSREGMVVAIRHGVRIASCGLALALATVAYFGPEGVWFNMVEIPSRLPWTPELASRISILAPLLALHIGVPAIGLIIWRKQIWHRESPWLLPAITWATALPMGLAPLLKIGGSINSLQSLLLFLPPAAVLLVAQSTRRRVGLVFAALALLFFAERIHHAAPPMWTPRIRHLEEAKQLATQYRNRIWFPWNPLVSYYADGRMDHAEDGLFIRFVAGRPLNLQEARAHLPPQWSALAIRDGGYDWGLAVRLCPPEAVETNVGFWVLYSWPVKQ